MELDANAIGGTPPYAYQWYNLTSGNPVAITGGVSSNFIFTANAPGNFIYDATVTDNALVPSSVTTSNVLITIYPSHMSTSSNTVSSCFTLTPPTHVNVSFYNENSLFKFGTNSTSTTGCFSVTNVTSGTTDASGDTTLAALNITYTKTAGTTILITGTLPYTCGTSPDDLVVYSFLGGKKTSVPFTADESACTVTFTISEDPIVGLFLIPSGKSTTFIAPTFQPQSVTTIPTAPITIPTTVSPTTVAPTTVATTVAPVTIITSTGTAAPASPPTPSVPMETIGGVTAGAAGASRLRKRLHRGPYKKTQYIGLHILEEMGIVDVIVMSAAIVLFLYGFVLASAIAAFGSGVGMVYLVDSAVSRKHKKRLSYVRRDGVMKVVEELGLLECAILIAAILLYASGYLLQGVILAWVFGVVFATMADKAKIRRERYLLRVVPA